jgi:hypothetical protein
LEAISDFARRRNVSGLFYSEATMTPDDLIEGLVAVHVGQSDARTRHLFRQSLEVLVELSKQQQIEEIALGYEYSRTAMTRAIH